MYRSGHFEERRRLDMIRFLVDMNMYHVVKKIFSYLGERDLVAISMTSATWYASLKQTPDAHARRIDFLWEMERDKVRRSGEKVSSSFFFHSTVRCSP